VTVTDGVPSNAHELWTEEFLADFAKKIIFWEVKDNKRMIRLMHSLIWVNMAYLVQPQSYPRWYRWRVSALLWRNEIDVHDSSDVRWRITRSLVRSLLRTVSHRKTLVSVRAEDSSMECADRRKRLIIHDPRLSS
jgi:hypothetical protein